MPDYRGTVATDAGMWLVWQPEALAAVQDYDTWWAELGSEADLLRHIAAGDCAPVNIGMDMAAGFVVRVARPRSVLRAAAPAELTERERACLTASSEPYLLVSRGRAVLSGVEAVMGGEARLELPLPAGDWSVEVHLVDWEMEPANAVDGNPGPEALPDFVVLLNPADPGQSFRLALSTFDSPPG